MWKEDIINNNILEIDASVGESKPKALPEFYAFTENDYDSSFYEIG